MARRTILSILVLLVAIAVVVWFVVNRNDEDASENTELSLSAFNQTKNAEATTVAANPNDVLVYTLNVANTSDDVISSYVVETNIDDLSELATLTDAAGANYNASTNSLMWTPLDIPANGSIQKTFSIRVKETLPTDSDLVMSTAFGGNVDVAVAQPTVVTPVPVPTPVATAPGSTPSYQAPTTGPSVWFAFMLALTFTAGIVLYRASKRIIL